MRGYAHGREGSWMYEMHKDGGIVVEVDVREDKIVNGEFRFIREVRENFLGKVVIG
ncbi:DUF3870 domain-containing protein [Priestia megaterium]|uniref:DUF3870 domain-containing protein n=1 Tax=Priestia megaterium TaxID=1404 RepID=UPI0021C07CAD|nr:DUF3870 domain-containing protein [Priestia megaterium]